MDSRSYASQVQILGWLYIVGNGFVLSLGLIALFFFPAIGLVTSDATAMAILSTVGLSGAAFFAVLALPGLIAGYGLLTRRPWARILSLVVAILGLANFPVGTAIGVYAFWVLLQNEAVDYFSPVKPA